MEYQDQEAIDPEVIPTNNLQMYQQDKAAIISQIESAKRWPRNLQSCIDNVITEIAMDKKIAEDCTYSLKKGKTITGPSVVLARMMAQEWGNLRIDIKVIGADDTHVVSEAYAFDLEKNYAVRSQIKKSIVNSSGRYSEDLIVITGNAAAAVAERNVIFKIMKQSIITKLWDSAKSKVTGDLSDDSKLTARRVSIFEGLKKTYFDKNLNEQEILRSIGKSSVTHITKDDILVLIGYENSIKGGEQSFEDIFRPAMGYVNKPAPPAEKSEERLTELIKNAKTRKEMLGYKKYLKTSEHNELYDKYWLELK